MSSHPRVVHNTKMYESPLQLDGPARTCTAKQLTGCLNGVSSHPYQPITLFHLVLVPSRYTVNTMSNITMLHKINRLPRICTSKKQQNSNLEILAGNDLIEYWTGGSDSNHRSDSRSLELRRTVQHTRKA